MPSSRARNLVESDHEVDYVEISDKGMGQLAELGVTPTDGTIAAGRADVAILAVPDNIMGRVAESVVRG